MNIMSKIYFLISVVLFSEIVAYIYSKSAQNVPIFFYKFT